MLFACTVNYDCKSFDFAVLIPHFPGFPQLWDIFLEKNVQGVFSIEIVMWIDNDFFGFSFGVRRDEVGET